MAVAGDSLLVRAGLVRAESFAEAQAVRKREGGTLGECLVRIGAVTEEQLVAFFHQRLLVPRISEEDFERVSPEALAAIPADMASEFLVFPVKVDASRTLTLAMADPSDSHVVEEVSFFSGRFCQRAVASASVLRKAIEHHYGVRARAGRPLERLGERPSLLGAFRPRLATPRATSAAPPREPTPRAVRAAPAHEARREPVVLLTNVKDDGAPPTAEEVARRANRVTLARGEPPAAEAPIPLTKPVAPTGPIVKRARTLPGMPVSSSVELPLEPLRRAASREAIAAALIGFGAAIAPRSALLVMRRGALVGYDGAGDPLRLEALRQLSIPLDLPSLVRDVAQSRLPWRGALREPDLQRALAAVFGQPPVDDVLLLPIAVGDKVIALLYAESLLAPVADDALHRLAHEAGRAYERLILTARR